MWWLLLLVVLGVCVTGCAYPEGAYSKAGESEAGTALGEPGGPYPKARESEARRALREYEEQFEDLGGPPPKERTGNVIVVLEHHTYGQDDAMRIASAWRCVDESVVDDPRSGRLWARNGGRLGLATKDFRMALGVSVRGRRESISQRMMLTALGGHEASLAVGSNIYVPALRLWTWHGVVVLFEREFVGSSLVVVPEVVGEDQVRLSLFPRFTTRSRRVIDVTELTTTVVVPHGQTMVVGGLDESQNSLSYALFSVGGRRSSRKTLLLVTPYIEAAK